MYISYSYIYIISYCKLVNADNCMRGDDRSLIGLDLMMEHILMHGLMSDPAPVYGY